MILLGLTDRSDVKSPSRRCLPTRCPRFRRRRRRPSPARAAERWSRQSITFPGTTGPDGVDRISLGEAVLAPPRHLASWRRLFTPGRQREDQFLQRSACARHPPRLPLLFEKGGWDEVDKLPVFGTTEVQRERFLARPDDRKPVAEILALQMPDSEQRARANFVIPREAHRGNARHGGRIVACLNASRDS